jgi:transcriptional regulator with XRE-family HTH domain
LEQLRHLRESKGLSQAKLAQLAGLNPVTVHRIEHGYKSPTVKTLENLAEALSVEVGDFFPKVQPPLPLESEEARWQWSVEDLLKELYRTCDVHPGDLTEKEEIQLEERVLDMFRFLTERSEAARRGEMGL